MNYRILLFFLLSTCWFMNLNAQDSKKPDFYTEAQAKVDSLWMVIKQAEHDTTCIQLLLRIGDIYEYEMPDTALSYYQKALNLADKSLSDPSSAFPQSADALALLKAKTLSYIGVVHLNQGSYDKAVEYFLKSLRIYEELNNKEGMSSCYNNIGIVFKDQCNYAKAVEYYLKSANLDEELQDKIGMSKSYNNIGTLYIYQNDLDKALKYYKRSLNIKEGLIEGNPNDVSFKKGISSSYTNIGNIYCMKGNYEEAIDYFRRSLQIFKQLSDKNNTALVYTNIAALNLYIADSALNIGNKSKAKASLDSTIFYAEMAFNSALEIGAVPVQNDAAEHLQKTYTRLGNYKKAIKYAEIYIATQDSMFSEEKTKVLAEMGAKYESEKKELQIDNLNKENALKVAELSQSEEKRSKQLILIYSFVAGFIIILVFATIIFRLFVQKKKANLILAKQKQQIEIQNDKLHQANEEITAQRDEIAAKRDLVTEQKEYIEEQKQEIDDSINYAKRIQTAVLPADHYAESILGEHFIVFRPHSVVSGDFYWATQTEEWTILTVADCTGHGVPGAFMSMLGVSFLNEIVRKKPASPSGRDVTNAAEILNNLRASIIEALKQTGEDRMPPKASAVAQGNHLTASEVKDGMLANQTVKDGLDMSLIAIHKDRNRAQWAGANNPIWIIRSAADRKKQVEDNADIVEVIKGDNMPVSVHVRMDDFTNHEILLNKDDRIFLFTDGLPDQFGGPKGKKLKYKPFKRLLVENSIKPMCEQKEALESALDAWMNHDPDGSGTGGSKYEQVDDITVVGMKI